MIKKDMKDNLSTSDRKHVYDVLKLIVGDISVEGLAEKLGWTKQQLLNVICPVSREIKEKNKNEFLEIIESKDEFFLEEYYQDFLVDFSIQLQTKLKELNCNPKLKDWQYLKYLDMWKKYRGY